MPLASFEDFGNDLLDRFGLATELERAFGLAIPNYAIVRFVKVGEIVSYIENGLSRE